ncbi:uncharacterized protein [Euwallacea similis]|uniref:uncharacterized protein n=1 Tax=Euwallacea similis TaxID=1736056 RepID=UPI00344D3CD0
MAERLSIMSTYVIIDPEIEDLLKILEIVIYDEENANVYKLNIENCGSNISTKFVTNLKDKSWDACMMEWNMKEQFKDCPLKVEWTVLLPYINPPNSSLRGVLVDFLEAFEDISQRKVAFMPDNPAYLEEITQSYSFDSLLESFQSGYSDMFIGPVSLNAAEMFDCSPVVSEVISVLLGFFCISTFIQGSIVSTLSSSVYRISIQNIDELLDSNLPIKTFSSMSYLFQVSLNERDFEVYERMEILEGMSYPAEAGDLAVSLRNFATCVDSGYLIMRPNILKSFSVFKVFNMKQIIVMPRGIYYSQQYHEWFTKLLESGILSKFEKIYENYYAVQHFVEEDNRNFVITLDQLIPTLTLIGAIHLTSFVIFLGEIVQSNINKFIHKHMK